PRTPGCVSQTALPDNTDPTSARLDLPDNPLLDVGLLDGEAHARWDPEVGACVEPLADSSESLASLSLLPAIPSMSKSSDLADSGGKLSSALANMGPWSTLGGLLPGQGRPQGSGTNGLISLPHAMATRSSVSLVDMPAADQKAVRSTSALQLADVHLFEGTPFGINID